MVCVCGGGRTGCPKASTRSGGIERRGGCDKKNCVRDRWATMLFPGQKFLYNAASRTAKLQRM